MTAPDSLTDESVTEKLHREHFAPTMLFATAKALKSKGVNFAAEPKAESWGTSAIFKDPDGNRFVLGSR